MAVRPDFSRHRPDARLTRWRGRVGRLFRAEAEVGLVLLEVEPYARRLGGRLWWTRWAASRDVMWLWTLVEGVFADTLVPDDEVDRELRAYEAGRFEHHGEWLRVLWTDEDESRDLRASQFGR